MSNPFDNLAPTKKSSETVKTVTDAQYQPKFSVIVPFYNAAETLAKAIHSILQQSWPAYEIILVDDGSTDDSAEIAKAFTSHQVHYYYQENQGVSAARNFGVAKSGGDWLCFLDADDWYYPDRLQLHGEWLQQQPSIDILTGDFEYWVDGDNAIKRSLAQTPAGQYLLGKYPSQTQLTFDEHALTLFVGKHFGDTHTLSVRKTLFQQSGGYPTELKVCEDVSLLIRLCQHANCIGAVTQPLAAYYVHPSSATRSNPLFAQQQTLIAYKQLIQESFKPAIHTGLKAALRAANLDLAYCQLKQELRWAALRSITQGFFKREVTLRDVLSVTKSALGS
ncbi:glycosyltransferase [Motilimonas sp. 1_MG-2023]|uniref:glycosyltransferase n=1 Tax=Motilimonas sp. 1_MG-2023 TaxID=3062672 RepID=UPI0026E20D42|nr:glycosyltransferase [Motilimonas sp. 1_MG-2023]MDO6524839.1 glycosyltransferase [Motilimonas sp. 1_MG-2023]